MDCVEIINFVPAHLSQRQSGASKFSDFDSGHDLAYLAGADDVRFDDE